MVNLMKTPVKCYKDLDNEIRIESFYHIVNDKDADPFIFPLHYHEDFLEISLIISGEADFVYDRVNYKVRPKDLVVKNAGILHAEMSSPEGTFEQYCLGISGVHMPDLDPNCLLPPGASPVIQTGDAFDYLRAMTGYLYRIHRDPAQKYSELIRNTVENGITVVNMLIEDAVEASGQKHYSDLITSVLDYLDTEDGLRSSLDDLAKKNFVSSYYLAHRFKKEVGCTVNQYLLNRKMGAAQTRLVFTDDPIKEIAIDCGYSSLQYFYSVFKKNVGITPTDLRNRYKDDNYCIS